MISRRRRLFEIIAIILIVLISNTIVNRKSSVYINRYSSDNYYYDNNYKNMHDIKVNNNHSIGVLGNYDNSFSSTYNNIYSNDYGNNYSNSFGYNFGNVSNINRARKHVIGFAVASMSSSYLSLLVESSKAEAEKLGVEIIIADAEGDVQKQANQISNFIKQRVDAIILTPVDSKALVSSARMIKEANIPLINLSDRMDDIVSDLIDTYVGANATEQGELAAELMIDALGEKGGNVIIIEGMSNTDIAISKTKDFINKVLETESINVIDIKDASGDRRKAKEIMSALLQRIPEIDGVYAHNDNMIIGCIEAVKEVNRAEEIKFIGIGGTMEVYKYIKKGDLYGIVAQSPNWEGVQAVKSAVDILKNKKAKMWYRNSINKVTKENVDSFMEKW